MRVDIKDHAEDNLRFIASAMAKAERTSSHSGLGGIGMGLVALIAMAVASGSTVVTEQLLIWICAAPVAAGVGLIASLFKAKKLETTLFGDPGRRFLLCLVPVMTAAALISWALWPTPQIEMLPWIWMLLYGCGLLAAGSYAVPPISLMGGAFIVASLFTFALPNPWSNVLLGVAFGGLHILFGYQVYKQHGG